MNLPSDTGFWIQPNENYGIYTGVSVNGLSILILGGGLSRLLLVIRFDDHDRFADYMVTTTGVLKVAISLPHELCCRKTEHGMVRII